MARARSRRARLDHDFIPDTICDGLRGTLGAINFEILRAADAQVLTVDDAQVVAAMRLLWTRTKQLVEPSSATDAGGGAWRTARCSRDAASASSCRAATSTWTPCRPCSPRKCTPMKIDGTRAHDRATELVLAYYAAFNRGDWAGMQALLAEDVLHDLNQGRRETGKPAFAAFQQRMERCYREQLRDVVVMA
jgi:hypothetical protein